MDVVVRQRHNYETRWENSTDDDERERKTDEPCLTFEIYTVKTTIDCKLLHHKEKEV